MWRNPTPDDSTDDEVKGQWSTYRNLPESEMLLALTLGASLAAQTITDHHITHGQCNRFNYMDEKICIILCHKCLYDNIFLYPLSHLL